MNFNDTLTMLSKILQVLAYLGGGIISIGVIAYGIRYGFTKAKNAEVKESTNLLENLTERIGAQDLLIAKLQDDMKALQTQNIALQATNDAHEKTIREYMAILANRDPAFTDFMSDMKRFMADIHAFISANTHQTPMQTINVQK
jgi:hypothetical protein